MGLRLLPPSDLMPAVYEPDPELGYRYRPGAVGELVRKEMRAEVRVNAHGFRDRERAWEKPAGVFRVDVLGDSFVAGNHVPLEETFPSRLEAWIAARPPFEGVAAGGMSEVPTDDVPRWVEVLNLGVDGYGPHQEEIVLRQWGLDYHPDLVLLLLYPQNDVLDVRRGVYERSVVDGRVLLEMPMHEESGMGAGSHVRVDAWLKEHSRAWKLARDGAFLAAVRLGVVRPALPQAYREPWSASFEEALSKTLVHVARMRDASVEAGARFAVVLVPADVEADRREWANKTYASRLTDDVWERQCLRVTDVIARFAKEEGIPALDVVPEFRRRTADENAPALYWKYDAHLNELGYRTLAEVVGPWLEAQELLVPPVADREEEGL